jgi:hypothetical protein
VLSSASRSEISPRLGGVAVGDPNTASASAAVAPCVGQLTFTNGAATTYRQLSHGGNPESLYLGFNLTRKFF